MKSALLYEGKAKKVYSVSGEEFQLILEYKDDATAFNGEKHKIFRGKGRLNNLISSHIFQYLHEKGIASHFIQALSDTEQLVYQTRIIPIEVVVRNIATGSLTKRLGITEGAVFQEPLVELYYKEDALNDPLMNDDHAKHITGISEGELEFIKEQARNINNHLQAMYDKIGVKLVDFKLEFGRLHDGSIVLSDEISPDTCRLWEEETDRKMDKDVFRNDIEDLVEIYDTIWKRMEANVHV
ncbi:phosphoribosylaminoimidazolesuccinocarboxamide synthase [Pontibacillus yanchengensis]|uniref:Phosphoribosylaminoimidazole-succinocarboxamide synthase n=1 Tax=Pontibacillus yanchengensis TaxID=462910 RepID=A0A6I5A7G5_9BACI|nr:phosphoribosylaminoimidazolesuccinocarboxamide synthase [Pontibacillus yanchengensis]MYL36092.1 phosphoribosylaminoimidazolesuccinocarboxamide synthase [Pontibacillus yanchengensis]